MVGVGFSDPSHGTPEHTHCVEHKEYNWLDPFHKLFKMQNTGLLCDFTLQLSDGEIPAHKVVLAVRAPYFMKFFKSSLTSKDTDRAVLSEFRLDIMCLVVQYMYTGYVDISDLDVMIEVFKVADFFQIYSLINECCRNIFVDYLWWGTCSKVAKFLDQYGHQFVTKDENGEPNTQELQAVEDFICENWGHVIRKDDWYEFPFKLLIIILKSIRMNPKSEDEIFDGVFNWIKGNTVCGHIQDSEVSELMSLINFPSVSANKKEELYEYFNSPVAHINSIYSGPTRQYYGKTFYTFYNKEFIPVSERESVGFVHALANPDCHLQSYSKESNQWRDVRGSHWFEWDYLGTTNVASCDNKIYLINSLAFREFDMNYETWITPRKRSHERNVQEVVQYDPSTMQWTRCTDLNVATVESSAGGIGSTLYVCGGEPRDYTADEPDEHIASSALYFLDPESQSWAIKTRMKYARSSHNSVTLQDKLYVLGGYDVEGRPAPAECWDPQADVWAEFVTPNINRMELSATTTDNCIFILGGRLTLPLGPYNAEEMNTYLSTYRKFCYEWIDPREGFWHAPRDLPQKLYGFVAGSLEDEVYVIGGRDYGASPIRPSNKMFILDLRADQWREGAASILYDSYLSEEKISLRPTGLGVVQF